LLFGYKKAWMICVLFASLMGCGYRFAGGGNFPAGVDSVFVEIFGNRSSEVGLENIFTNDLIYEITRKSDVRLASKDNADAILSGVITEVTTTPASRRGESVAIERRVTVRVDLKLTNAQGKVLWSAKDVSANQTYFVGGLTQQTENNKSDALIALSKRFAEIIYNQLTTGF